jgi:hypothetical protein
MYSLKPIARPAIPAALQKAEHYRLLNDSVAAESICLDVLDVEPDNQHALVTLLLAITDQIGDELAAGVTRARAVLPRLTDDYRRHYYAGIICERRAKAQLHQRIPRAAEVAAGWLREAMQHYAQAEAIRPADNDESILRWNTCARTLNRSGQPHQPVAEVYEPTFE